MKAEFEERGGCPTKALSVRDIKWILIRMGKVNLNLNLFVIEILNALSV
jgi:hypothetical protein